ncbi:MAG TPA: hypothetical protein VEA16_07885, partial [Vicinamibacterales bacterium]|nr:hypothetical protein [Vicinamibacterales bacterium]
MAVLSVQKIVKAGLTPSLAAAAGGGDSWQNTGREFLEVANGGGGSINVTIAAQAGACATYGVTNSAHDIVVAVGAGVTKRIGPIDPIAYNDANGRAQITYSGVTSVTVGV